jgi:hypothetical protein
MRKPVITTRKILHCALAASFLLIVTCSLKLGDSPIGPAVNQPRQSDTTVTLTVSARSPMIADGLDTVIVTATLLDDQNNAVEGDTITFSSTIGTIGPRSIINHTGRCTVILTSAQVNDTCVVTAVAPRRHDTAVVRIIFGGVHLGLVANPNRIRVRDTIAVSGQLLDGSNRVIRHNDSITFTTVTGFFSNGGKTFSTQFDAAGLAEVRMTSPTIGTVWVHASAVGMNDSVSILFDSTSVPVVGSRLFTLYSSKTQLKADNSDTASITAMVMDENHNPAAGDTIFFACDLGMIGSYAVVDMYGDAKTWLRARPVNGTCIITAIDLKTNDTASTSVLFSGVTILLEPSATDLNLGIYATMTAILKDGSGNPIGGDSVIFTTTAPGRFENNNTTMRAYIDPTGRASVKVTSTAATRISVSASCLNTNDTAELFFTNNAITLTVSKDSIIVGGADSSYLTATYLDGTGTPVPNAVVFFYSNAGAITRDSVRTDINGKAYTWLKSANFTGTATVMASTMVGNALAKVAFKAAKVKKIKLTISPDNISVNGGVATLTATTWDAKDNLVNLADVNFLILAGPGGGEYIDKPMATTQNGRATAQLHAGSVPSMYRSVVVMASVGDTADTSKLTISGEPYAISVSYPQDDTVPVGNAGQMHETTFDYFIGAVVCDINGNPVSDGTRVNFSAVVSGMAVHRKYFVRWEGLTGTDPHAVYGYYLIDVPFEDINNNYKMDANDLKLDYTDLIASRGDDVNGDGRCDYNPVTNPDSADVWFDFNGNGRVDTGLTLRPVVDSSPVTVSILDTVCWDSLVHCILNPPDTIRRDSTAHVCLLQPHIDTLGPDTVCYDSLVNMKRVNYDTLKKDTTLSVCDSVLNIDTIGLDTLCYDTMVQCTTRIRPDTLWKDSTYTICRTVFIRDTHTVWACHDSVIHRITIIPHDTLWFDTTVFVCRVFLKTTTKDTSICHDSIIHLITIVPPDTIWMDSIVHVCRVGFRPDTIGWKKDTTYSYSYIGCEPYIEVGGVMIWADLYPDGVWNTSELVRDNNHNGRFDIPKSGDRLWYEYECLPYWFNERFDFKNNDFGIAINTSATTTAGVANVKLTYPRQLARRLIVSVNVESNGVRDRTGARFVLPLILGN